MKTETKATEQAQQQPAIIKKQVVINKTGTGSIGNTIYLAMGALVASIAQYFGYDIQSLLAMIGLA